MTEPAIAAVEGALVQGAVKVLAPEAEALLNDLHDTAAAAVARIDEVVPGLLAKAENESAIALRTAQQHLAGLLDHVRGVLSGDWNARNLQAPASRPDPTPAVPAPQATQS